MSSPAADPHERERPGWTSPAALVTAAAGLALTGLVLAGLAALLDGSRAVASVGAGLGLLVLLATVGAGSLRAAAAAPPVLTLMIALLTYALQVVLLGLAFVALRRSGALDGPLDRRWLGGTVIAGTVVASGLVVWVALHVRPRSQPPYHSSEAPPTTREERRGAQDTGG